METNTIKEKPYLQRQSREANRFPSKGFEGGRVHVKISCDEKTLPLKKRVEGKLSEMKLE